MNPAPNQTAVQDSSGNITAPWQIYFSQVFKAITALESSGTTAQRPVKGLFVGRQYFDTSLGYVIHYNGINWVNSAGSVV